jgi:hypothetical protein
VIDPKADTPEPFAVERAVLMTAGIAQSSSRMLDSLLQLLIRKGVITQGEIEEIVKEPEFSAETMRQYEAFFKSTKL